MRRVEDDETADDLRRTDARGPGDGTAPIVAHDICLTRAQSEDGFTHIGEKRRQVVAWAWLIREVVAAQVGGDDAVPVGKGRELKAPRIGIFWETMKEQHEGAVGWPGLHKVQLHPIDG